MKVSSCRLTLCDHNDFCQICSLSTMSFTILNSPTRGRVLNAGVSIISSSNLILLYELWSRGVFHFRFCKVGLLVISCGQNVVSLT